MSLIYLLPDFPVQNLPIDGFPLSFLILGLFNYYFLFRLLFNGESKPIKFFSGLLDDLKVVAIEKKEKDLENLISNKESDKCEEICSGEEVEIMMERLGISWNPEGARIRGRIGSEDIHKLFDEKPPSTEELKEAFDVFDGNRDGYIDDSDLARVLSALGFSEGADKQSCLRMISAFDEDGDGLMDFIEFVKFMESCSL